MSHRHGTHGLLQRVVNRPLLVTPSMARFYLGYLGERRHLTGRLVDSGEATPIRELTAFGRYAPAKSSPYPTLADRRIAVIEIEGALVHKAGRLAPESGMTGYDAIEFKLQHALADRDIDGIVLDIHSHGGEAAGAFDLADKIAAARAIKPVLAIVDELAYSAAYLIASQASRIVTPRTGGVGSVGVVAMHVDESQWLTREGFTVTLIHAGSHKVDGNPFSPLPPTVRDTWQREIDALHALFVRAVARGRGLDANAVRRTEARKFTAEEALAGGFVDAIMPASEALEEFAKAATRSRRSPAPAPPAVRVAARSPRRAAEQSKADCIRSLCVAGEEKIAEALIAHDYSIEGAAAQLTMLRDPAFRVEWDYNERIRALHHDDLGAYLAGFVRHPAPGRVSR